jgi:hypothetical protein
VVLVSIASSSPRDRSALSEAPRKPVGIVIAPLRPLPEPGTVEAFVIEALENAALDVIERERGWSYCDVVVAAGFLRWLQMCALADLLDSERP